MSKIERVSLAVSRCEAILHNMNVGRDALGNVWDEARLGPIERERYHAAIRLDAARSRLAQIKAGRLGGDFPKLAR